MNVFYCLSIPFLFVWLYKLHRKRGGSLRLPPGPPGKFLVGNVFDIPLISPWLVFTEWGKKYGDLIFLEALGTKLLIVNTMEAVTDLLEKRGSIYSGRPELVMGCELVGLNKTLAMMPYGARWRGFRKLTHLAFGPGRVDRYCRGQEEIATLLLGGLLENPTAFNSLLSLAAGRVAMAVTYGVPIQSAEDKYITEAESAVQLVSGVLRPGAYLVDTFTFLKYLPEWFPFASFQRQAKAGRMLVEHVVRRPFKHVEREMASGKAPPSFLHDALLARESDSPDMTNDGLTWVAGSMYGAAGETTWVVLGNFVLAMSLFPEKQALAQAEIDRVVGTTRLPTFEDQDSLPYVNALIKELMRFYPPVPLSLPRCSTEDDYYKGQFIPAGTIIMPNVWAITRAEQNGDNVDEFSPERFLDPSINPIAPASYTFGFGRRFCPGKHLAANSIFIAIASMLAAFTVSKELDEKGKEITPNPTFSSGIICRAEDFPCRIVPRSEAVVELIRCKMPEQVAGKYTYHL